MVVGPLILLISLLQRGESPNSLTWERRALKAEDNVAELQKQLKKCRESEGFYIFQIQQLQDTSICK